MKKYAPQFQNLKKWSTIRLQPLCPTSRIEWTRKYLQISISLHSNTYAQIYSTLNALEAEMMDNNLSAAIITEIEQEYATANTEKIAELVRLTQCVQTYCCRKQVE